MSQKNGDEKSSFFFTITPPSTAPPAPFFVPPIYFDDVMNSGVQPQSSYVCCGFVWPDLSSYALHQQQVHQQGKGLVEEVAGSLLEMGEKATRCSIFSSFCGALPVGIFNNEDLRTLQGMIHQDVLEPIPESEDDETLRERVKNLLLETFGGQAAKKLKRVGPFKAYVNRAELRPYQCVLPGCGKSYKNANGLKYHARHGHRKELEGKERRFRCLREGCEKRYRNANGLKYHTEHGHKDEEQK